MDTLKKYLAGDQFAAANGIELVDVAPGRARTRLTLQRRHQNSLAIAHGGAIFTLAATAFFAAASAGGKVAVGVNLNIAFAKPVAKGTLEAEAIEEARSRRTTTCTIRVTDDNQTLVAVLQGMAYVKETPIPAGS